MNGVSRTALGVAAVRAYESEQPDRLFEDPFAAGFLATVPGAFDAEQRAYEQAPEAAAQTAAFAHNVVLRTRFFDDFLRASIEGGLRQCVILAAGLDTRANRLAWPPGSVVYELDLPDVFAFKDSVLAPPAHRRALGVDLRTDWTGPLRDAGFDAHEPCVWLIEGLLMYLSEAEAKLLIDRVTALSAAGSRLALDLDDDAARVDARKLPAMRHLAGLWRGGLSDADQQLQHRGWRTEVHERAALATRYARPGRATGTLLVATRPPRPESPSGSGPEPAAA